MIKLVKIYLYPGHNVSNTVFIAEVKSGLSYKDATAKLEKVFILALKYQEAAENLSLRRDKLSENEEFFEDGDDTKKVKQYFRICMN